MSGKRPRYLSIGTIQVSIEMNSSEAGRIAKILFTPSKEYSISHSGKEYAALMAKKEDSKCGKLAAYGPDRGSWMKVSRQFPGLVEAALNQCAVEIEVKSKSNCKDEKWSLCAITIPPPNRRK